MVAKTTIVKDIIDYDSGYITCPTLYEYLDALERLMIIENQPAYSTHIIFLRTHRLEHYRLQPTFPTVMACSGLSPYSFRPFWGYTQFKARRGRDTKGINL